MKIQEEMTKNRQADQLWWHTLIGLSKEAEVGGAQV